MPYNSFICMIPYPNIWYHLEQVKAPPPPPSQNCCIMYFDGHSIL